MSSSIYSTFSTNKNLEHEGIDVRYNDIKFVIARAGGSNQAFKKAFGKKIKPFRSQIENESMDDDVAIEILAEVYAETVIRGWYSIKKDADGNPVVKKGVPEWVDKMPDREGKLMPYSTENCVALLVELPELFKDLQYMASKTANFRLAEDEKDEKN